MRQLEFQADDTASKRRLKTLIYGFNAGELSIRGVDSLMRAASVSRKLGKLVGKSLAELETLPDLQASATVWLEEEEYQLILAWLKEVLRPWAMGAAELIVETIEWLESIERQDAPAEASKSRG